jgi:trehalose synthase
MVNIRDYARITGEEVINGLFLIAKKLNGRMIQHINSTSVGGGVAEILMRMLPLMKQLGVNTRWDVIKGDERFFNITKAMHNALHGVPVSFKREDFDYFVEVNMHNAAEMNFDGDMVFVHDPQPVCLVERKKESGKKWAWRCHIDFTNPQKDVIAFLEKYIEQYDSSVFSAPAFARQLKIPQILISPSIDPLSDKNKDLPEKLITGIVEKYGIDPKRNIVSQISRFDYLKDPVGVVEVYKKVKKYIDCQLVLAGGGATDDPEGMKVLEEVKEAAHGDNDIHILFLPPSSDIEINALQRASTVILQKSLKEGFGLTVAEALWKGKPVIAGAVGGIPLQIKHQYSGILTYTIDGTAFYLKQLLNEPVFAKELGLNGKNHIKENFLITRHIRDYLLLFHSMLNTGNIISLD